MPFPPSIDAGLRAGRISDANGSMHALAEHLHIFSLTVTEKERKINDLTPVKVSGAKAGRGVIFCLLRRGAAQIQAACDRREMSGLSHGELQELVVKLLGKVTELERIVAEQRKEIARLKGLKGSKNIKQSGMEKGTAPKQRRRDKRRWFESRSPATRVSLEEQTLHAVIPAESRSRNAAVFVAQDLLLPGRVILFRCDTKRHAECRTNPAEFGPRVASIWNGLRRFVLLQCTAGKDVGEAEAQLRAVGISISKRQVMRLLIDGQGDFLSRTFTNCGPA